MPRYRIHRMKGGPRENFRWAPHTGGLATLRPKDYEVGDAVEAANPYAAWKLLTNSGGPLQPGDVLEVVQPESTNLEVHSELLINKYVGFEPAQWCVAEVKPVSTVPVPSLEGETMKALPG